MYEEGLGRGVGWTQSTYNESNQCLAQTGTDTHQIYMRHRERVQLGQTDNALLMSAVQKSWLVA